MSTAPSAARRTNRPPTGELIRIVQDRTATREARLVAGTELGQAGDCRPGVLTIEPEWCVVAEGPFQMGSDPRDDSEAFDRESPRHERSLAAYAVARYPVTNGQWLRFVDAHGYAEPQWWLRAGWHARISGGWNAPRTWRDTDWPGNTANRPVVGISWFEAMAYASWLSSRLGYRVDVCTEAEWEKAARGDDARRYPFGNALDPDAVHAGTATAEWLQAPAPVGCYPRGVSPWGAEDLVGNSYSWTRSRWGADEHTPSFRYPYVPDDGREELEGDDYRIVRGGAWSFPLANARCSYRGKDRPEQAFNNVGVRLVSRMNPAPRSPSPGVEKEQRL